MVSGQSYAMAKVQILMSLRSPKSLVKGDTVTVWPVSSIMVALDPKQQVSAWESNSAQLWVVAFSSLTRECILLDHTAAVSQVLEAR